MSGLQWDKVLLYLDDVICHASNFEDMKDVLCERFKQANLTLKPSKCRLLQTQVQFLGFVVSREGTHCDEKKIECIKNWETPKNIHDV